MNNSSTSCNDCQCDFVLKNSFVPKTKEFAGLDKCDERDLNKCNIIFLYKNKNGTTAIPASTDSMQVPVESKITLQNYQ